MATAHFSKDIFEAVELRLSGGDKMFGFVLPGGSERLGQGSEAFVRPLKRRRDDEKIVDEDLKLMLKTHAFCSLVDVDTYSLLEDGDPLCCMPFLTHGKELARRLVGILIQSGVDILLCLKVEVYGRRKSEDPHASDLAMPDARPFKVVNEEHDSARQVMIGTVRWNALITLAVVVTTGQIVVGPHNPSFHPHTASHVWMLMDGKKDMFNNIERQTRSKFDRVETYQSFAAAHPRFLGHRTLPVTLSTLWDFKSSGRWSGIKVAAFLFHQVYVRGKVSKADVEKRLGMCRAEKDDSVLSAILQQLVEDMEPEERRPVSEKVNKNLTTLAGRISGNMSVINKGTVATEVEMLIKNIIKGRQQ
ncbi:hypothetical protein F5H01DRAFT_359200 [Linnemannia elongata]|nr:hypothetical protein F5H01DRAFT_359200 [Linnemannia elongata]